MITLLVISQDPHMHKRVKNLLTGHDVLFTEPAKDQREAMHIVKQNQPDLVLVDLLLPEESGLDVIKNFEKIKLDASIILLTPVRNRSLVDRAIRTGARDVLVLPVSDEELTSTILHRKRLIEDV
jgi:response regulator of citrate/malate metabolism